MAEDAPLTSESHSENTPGSPQNEILKLIAETRADLARFRELLIEQLAKDSASRDKLVCDASLERIRNSERHLHTLYEILRNASAKSLLGANPCTGVASSSSVNHSYPRPLSYLMPRSTLYQASIQRQQQQQYQRATSQPETSEQVDEPSQQAEQLPQRRPNTRGTRSHSPYQVPETVSQRTRRFSAALNATQQAEASTEQEAHTRASTVATQEDQQVLREMQELQQLLIQKKEQRQQPGPQRQQPQTQRQRTSPRKKSSVPNNASDSARGESQTSLDISAAPAPSAATRFKSRRQALPRTTQTRSTTRSGSQKEKEAAESTTLPIFRATTIAMQPEPPATAVETTAESIDLEQESVGASMAVGGERESVEASTTIEAERESVEISTAMEAETNIQIEKPNVHKEVIFIDDSSSSEMSFREEDLIVSSSLSSIYTDLEDEESMEWFPHNEEKNHAPTDSAVASGQTVVDKEQQPRPDEELERTTVEEKAIVPEGVVGEESQASESVAATKQQGQSSISPRPAVESLPTATESFNPKTTPPESATTQEQSSSMGMTENQAVSTTSPTQNTRSKVPSVPVTSASSIPISSLIEPDEFRVASSLRGNPASLVADGHIGHFKARKRPLLHELTEADTQDLAKWPPNIWAGRLLFGEEIEAWSIVSDGWFPAKALWYKKFQDKVNGPHWRLKVHFIGYTISFDTWVIVNDQGMQYLRRKGETKAKGEVLGPVGLAENIGVGISAEEERSLFTKIWTKCAYFLCGGGKSVRWTMRLTVDD